MSDAAPRASSIDVSRPPMAPAGMDALWRAAASKELSYARLLTEWLALWLRRRLSIEEYLGLQLFDNTFYGMADKTAFVGMDGARRILMRANYRFDLYGLIDNKIACDFLLAAHGLPIMPTIALYRHASGMAAPFLLRSPEELRIFLSDNGRYPLFGKPLGGTRSLGSVSFDRYAAARDALVTFGGGEITLDAFVRDIAAHYPSAISFKDASVHTRRYALCAGTDWQPCECSRRRPARDRRSCAPRGRSPPAAMPPTISGASAICWRSSTSSAGRSSARCERARMASRR
jgi:hypothetical protein